ncbi:hypothetical protein Avbf_11699 [Armadillidium vulgare]|nr:hypothetical protein Avbf_11699 [Armadillidium vulgare]
MFAFRYVTLLLLICSVFLVSEAVPYRRYYTRQYSQPVVRGGGYVGYHRPRFYGGFGGYSLEGFGGNSPEFFG